MTHLSDWRMALVGVVLGACATAAPPSTGIAASRAPKPRVVVTTDPELDDSNSLLRYLLYATDFRTEGLVYASSQFHWPAPASVAAATSIEQFMRSLEGIGEEGPATRPPSPRPNFAPAAQNDFAARVRWSVTPTFGGANHEPVVAIRGAARLTARPGETIRLEGSVSDPDGNAVAVRWWRWKDADTYPGDVALSDSTSLATSVRVPDDATAGQTIQLVLEATDDGTPPLTSYRRIVVTVAGSTPRGGSGSNKFEEQ